MHTFFLAPEAWSDPWRLDGPEAHHFIQVLRGRAGDEIRLLDGAGREGFFTVRTIAKRHIELEPVREVFHAKPEQQTILALAWTKAVRRGWLMEKAVELGADALWIWQGAHSQMRLPDEIPASWNQQLIAGAKQCVNPWLPEIRLVPAGTAGLLADLPTVDRALVLWEDEEERFLTPDELALPGRTLFIIGPEGGFSREEIDSLRAAALPTYTVGRRILRYETAALLCLGLSWWGRERARG